jgi:L-fuculose-phosphate aldolase
MSVEPELREAICEFGRRMYARNLVGGTDGNLSARLPNGTFLCTPSGVSKGYMKPDDLIVADEKGAKLGGTGKVTSEFFTHLACYEERPDIAAVVHAHPPIATAFTLAGVSLAEPVLPELVAALGGIPVTAYATPGTPEGNEVIRPLIRLCDGVMLARHGSVTVGTSLESAYFKLEKIEHSATVLLAARQLGGASLLGAAEVERVLATRAPYGATGPVYTAELYRNSRDKER